LGQLKSLKVLNLQSNQLETLPKEISTLPLTKINLSRNHFSEFPTEIIAISTLENFDISFNQVNFLSFFLSFFLKKKNNK